MFGLCRDLLGLLFSYGGSADQMQKAIGCFSVHPFLGVVLGGGPGRTKETLNQRMPMRQPSGAPGRGVAARAGRLWIQVPQAW